MPCCSMLLWNKSLVSTRFLNNHFNIHPTWTPSLPHIFTIYCYLFHFFSVPAEFANISNVFVDLCDIISIILIIASLCVWLEYYCTILQLDYHVPHHDVYHKMSRVFVPCYQILISVRNSHGKNVPIHIWDQESCIRSVGSHNICRDNSSKL